jgi:hypothetical protein
LFGRILVSVILSATLFLTTLLVFAARRRCGLLAEILKLVVLQTAESTCLRTKLFSIFILYSLFLFVGFVV